ncbi:hypothetical protein SAMN05444285_10617 [Draconibacterium orientale]|uniref:Carbohydrate esterase 2 N-terminal domain-containing protein n=1 Tax=Draconibacterium orientale TaxID=1168034 RepID=X5DLN7_9BACT|nr:hypothetical protein [Draconibacterium orientale]AHW61472.1 hypothetical protein FH5T_01720 [Draconibacterium orientale]SET09600.1 hypothetical protein SAMN05444285_10617 [Draconibacterium orientale]
MRIVGIFLLLVMCLTTQAQTDQDLSTLVDGVTFPNPVFVSPDPPKPIKGWELTSVSDEKVLKGEYPGEIIKFRFKGTAVGILVYSDNHSGIIEYSLDGQPWFELDTFSKDAETTLKGYTLDKDLKNRKHTLQIRIMERNNPESLGTNIALRSFYTNCSLKSCMEF